MLSLSSQNRLRIIAIVLMMVTALNALATGYSFMVDPSGAGLGMSTSFIQNSPFTDFFYTRYYSFHFQWPDEHRYLTNCYTKRERLFSANLPAGTNSPGMDHYSINDGRNFSSAAFDNGHHWRLSYHYRGFAYEPGYLISSRYQSLLQRSCYTVIR